MEDQHLVCAGKGAEGVSVTPEELGFTREEWARLQRVYRSTVDGLPVLVQVAFNAMVLTANTHGQLAFSAPGRGALFESMGVEPDEEQEVNESLDALISAGAVTEHWWGWRIEGWSI